MKPIQSVNQSCPFSIPSLQAYLLEDIFSMKHIVGSNYFFVFLDNYVSQ